MEGAAFGFRDAQAVNANIAGTRRFPSLPVPAYPRRTDGRKEGVEVRFQREYGTFVGFELSFRSH